MEDLHPPRTAWAPRTRLEQVVWGSKLAYTMDTVTGQVLALAGGMPQVVHHSVLQPDARELLALAGWEAPQRVLPYRTEEEAHSLARDLAADGWRIVHPFPLVPGTVPEEALLVPSRLYVDLNDKATLARHVPEHLLPERVVLSPDRLSEVEDLFAGDPVVLKVATHLGSGGGRDVVFCREAGQRRAQLEQLLAIGGAWHALVVERLMDFEALWCAGLAVTDRGVLWLGAPRHERDDHHGLQIGSEAGLEEDLPEWLRTELLAIGARAGQRGYRGIAGVDVGIDRQGRYRIIDLNFRLNSSTPMLLALRPALERVGARHARLWVMYSDLSLREVVERLRAPVGAGLVVPLRLADLSWFAGTAARLQMIAFVLGADPADSARRREEFRRLFG